MFDIQYKRAAKNEELQQILELQKANLPQSLSELEQQNDGFLSIKHTFTLLKAMNDACPHIIAIHRNKIIGYALCMTITFREAIPIAKSLFEKIEQLLDKAEKYIVMGQVCVDKMHREKGIFRGLYQYMQDVLQSGYDIIITEVDVKNIRSVNAHRAIGFKILYSYRANQQNWHIISLNLN